MLKESALQGEEWRGEKNVEKWNKMQIYVEEKKLNHKKKCINCCKSWKMLDLIEQLARCSLFFALFNDDDDEGRNVDF